MLQYLEIVLKMSCDCMLKNLSVLCNLYLLHILWMLQLLQFFTSLIFFRPMLRLRLMLSWRIRPGMRLRVMLKAQGSNLKALRCLEILEDIEILEDTENIRNIAGVATYWNILKMRRSIICHYESWWPLSKPTMNNLEIYMKTDFKVKVFKISFCFSNSSNLRDVPWVLMNLNEFKGYIRSFWKIWMISNDV